MFPFVSKRSVLRASRRQATQVGRTLQAAAKATAKATQKATETAAREAVRQADKATRALVRPRRPAAAAGVRTAPGRFVEVDGLRVHAIVRGRGRPVVLIHGNGTLAEDYAICGLIDRLATRYRVIAPDRPGFGYTPRPRHRLWTASTQARLLLRLLDELGVERPLVVGHSWGTLVTLAMAEEAQERLRGIVLLSGYYFAEPRADVTLAGPMALPGIGDAARAMVPGAVNQALAEQSFRRVFRPQPVPPRFSARFPVEIAAGATQLRAVTEDAAAMNAAASWLQRGYGRLTLPVAILTGDADAVVNATAQSVRLHTAIGRSSLQILPGQGHMIHYGGRAKVEQAIDRLMELPVRRA